MSMPSKQMKMGPGNETLDELVGLARVSIPDEIEKKFIRLRDLWKSQRGPESSTTRLMMHPAYQKIIGMGPAVVPLLLRELEHEPDNWFWALRAITEEDPVPPETRGDGGAMARAWLNWARERGYQW
jgi:hypothetical protein